MKKHLTVVFSAVMAASWVVQIAAAQSGGTKDQDCEKIKEEIKELQGDLADLNAALQHAQDDLDRTTQSLQRVQGLVQKWEKMRISSSVEESFGRMLESQRQLLLMRRSLNNLIQELKQEIEAVKNAINDLLNKLGDCGPKKTAAIVTPGSSTAGTSTASGVESCLVGTWRSQAATIPGQTGGAGIILTIKGDGTQSVDYKAMEPLKDARGNVNFWAGTASGHVAAEKGTATLKGVTQSALTHTFTPANGAARTNSMSGDLGPAGLGGNPFDHSYTCDATTLKFKFVAFTFTFNRQGGATREK
jgi:hypothetical protein